jgi:Resolvase, N terminal domain
MPPPIRNASCPSTPPAPPIAPCKAVSTLTEQGAVTECEHRGYRRDLADPDACNRASEEAWRNPFPGAAPLEASQVLIIAACLGDSLSQITEALRSRADVRQRAPWRRTLVLVTMWAADALCLNDGGASCLAILDPDEWARVGRPTDNGNKPMLRKELPKAIAYFRTSSETNVGADKDSLQRQRQAVVKYAQAAGYEVIAEYADDGVKGADPWTSVLASLT